jgi:hypothetical protein
LRQRLETLYLSFEQLRLLNLHPASWPMEATLASSPALYFEQDSASRLPRKSQRTPAQAALT